MVARMRLPVPRWALAAFVAGVASLLAPPSYAMQVAPIEPVVWETADGGNGHTYLFVPLPRRTSWSEANELAATITLPDGAQGYLATIDSAEERAFIRQQVLPDRVAKPFSAVWIAPEDEFLLVKRGHRRWHGHGPKHRGGSHSDGWHELASAAVSPEHWNWAKWRSEHGPDDDRPFESRFLAKWFQKYGHGHWHGSHDGCSHGPPSSHFPKIIGMIVEFDPTDVPEPGAALLSALGIALLGLRLRRS